MVGVGRATSRWQMFAWNMSKIGPLKRKMVMYPHLYSYTSVKTVVVCRTARLAAADQQQHWFQIVAARTFQQYNDSDRLFRNKYEDIAPNVRARSHCANAQCAQPYPIRQIQVPIAIFYGGVDFLTDVQWLISKLPKVLAPAPRQARHQRRAPSSTASRTMSIST